MPSVYSKTGVPSKGAWASIGAGQTANSNVQVSRLYGGDAHIAQAPTQPGVFDNYNNYMWGFENDKQKKMDILKATFVMGVDIDESFLTSTVMPKRYTNNINLTVNQTVYPHQPPNRVPQLGPVRTLSSRRTEKQFSLQRAGVGIEMSKSHLRQPEGQEDYQNKVAQIIVSITKYLEQDALIALVSVGEYQAQYNAKYGRMTQDQTTRLRATMIERDIKVWGYFQQVPNALPKLDSWIDQLRRELNLQDQLDTYIMSKQVSNYLSEYPLDQTVYAIYGPGAQRNIKDHAQFGGSAKFRNTSIYLTDFFYVGEEGKPVDPLETRTQIGQYEENRHESKTNRYYESKCRTIRIFDQEADDWSEVDLMSCLENCKRFDKSGNIIPFGSSLLQFSSSQNYRKEELDNDPLHHMIGTQRVPITFLGHANLPTNVYSDAVETIFTQINRASPHLTESEVKKTFSIFENILERNGRMVYDEKYMLWLKILKRNGFQTSPQGSFAIPTFIDDKHPQNPALYEFSEYNPTNITEDYGSTDKATFIQSSLGRFAANLKNPYLELQAVGNGLKERRNLLWELRSYGYSLPPTTRLFEDFETIQSMVLSDLWKSTPFGQAEGLNIKNAVDNFKEIVDILYSAFPNNPIFLPQKTKQTQSKYSAAFENLIGYKYPYRPARFMEFRSNGGASSSQGNSNPVAWSALIPSGSQLLKNLRDISGIPADQDKNVTKKTIKGNVVARNIQDFSNELADKLLDYSTYYNDLPIATRKSSPEARKKSIGEFVEANKEEIIDIFLKSQGNELSTFSVSMGQNAFLWWVLKASNNDLPNDNLITPTQYNSENPITPDEIRTPRDKKSNNIGEYGTIYLFAGDWDGMDFQNRLEERWSLWNDILLEKAQGSVSFESENVFSGSSSSEVRELGSQTSSEDFNIFDALAKSSNVQNTSSNKRQKRNKTSSMQTNAPVKINAQLITRQLRSQYRTLVSMMNGASLAFALIYMMTPVTLRNCRALINANIRFPWTFIIARPHMEYAGLSIIKCKAGCGYTYYGNVEALVSEDNIIGIEKMSTWWYSGGIIHEEENVVVVPNVFITRYIGGGGTEWIDEDAYDPLAGVYRATREQSMFSILVRDDEKMLNVSTLSGTFTLTDGAGGQNQKLKSVREGVYSSAPWYNFFWGWCDVQWNRRDENAFLDSDATYYSEFLKNNQVICKSSVIYPDQNGKYSESDKTQQTGHWKTKATYAGCMGARLGIDTFKTPIISV
jgi:hypothetical protein